jgi:hypothetical protein
MENLEEYIALLQKINDLSYDLEGKCKCRTMSRQLANLVTSRGSKCGSANVGRTNKRLSTHRGYTSPGWEPYRYGREGFGRDATRCLRTVLRYLNLPCHCR